MPQPQLLKDGDVVVPTDDGELRFSPGDEDYTFWLSRARHRQRPSWDGPLTANQLLGLIIAIALVVLVIGTIANAAH